MAKQEVKTGQTDYTVLVFIPDPASTDGSGKTGLVAANLTVSGIRVETDNDVTVTDYTASLNNLAALTTAHTDWGVLEVSSTLAPGLYRLDIADAIFASGAWSAVVYVEITTSAAAASPMEFVMVPDAPITGVSVSMLGGDTQSATDLKDFADAGYDPATNKVQGVVLTDTLTTYTGNTVQTGDTYALANGASGFVAIAGYIDTEVGAIKAKTDQLTFTVANVVDANTLRVGGTVQTAGDIEADIALISTATNSGDLASKTADAGAIISATGTVISGTYTDTASDNNTYWITAPVTPAVAGFGLRQNLRFDLVLGRVPTQLQIKGYWNGSGQTAEIYALNARTGVYDKLTNSGTNLLSRSSEFTYAITIPRDYADDTGGVNNIVTIEIRSTSTNTGHRMRIDQALIYHVDEAAVFTITTPTAEQIWTYINRTLTTPGVEPISPPTAAEITTAVLAGAAADPIAANIQEVNDVVVTGDGQPGTEWGP